MAGPDEPVQPLAICKVIFTGPQNAGKTNLLYRLKVGQQPPELNQSTVGVDFHVFTYSDTENPTPIKFQCWDTSGEQRFQIIRKSYYKRTSVSVLCYDVSAETFPEAELNAFISEAEAEKMSDNTQWILVGVHGRKKPLNLKTQQNAQTFFAQQQTQRNFVAHQTANFMTGEGCEELKQTLYKTYQTYHAGHSLDHNAGRTPSRTNASSNSKIPSPADVAKQSKKAAAKLLFWQTNIYYTHERQKFIGVTTGTNPFILLFSEVLANYNPAGTGWFDSLSNWIKYKQRHHKDFVKGQIQALELDTTTTTLPHEILLELIRTFQRQHFAAKIHWYGDLSTLLQATILATVDTAQQEAVFKQLDTILDVPRAMQPGR